ncbi:hypothetical protein Y032_0007g3340 [Ancylostoma ceylanicum]|uniref:Uncharacterized protein n=1 Tax=Ancylostoma ceylanicum TaxID=53326 RepID=A0A016VNQ3_9BILA|nr:hypothetical protein Y032_0007g3340 [Ancylostoma ceylanicum]
MLRKQNANSLWKVRKAKSDHVLQTRELDVSSIARSGTERPTITVAVGKHAPVQRCSRAESTMMGDANGCINLNEHFLNPSSSCKRCADL